MSFINFKVISSPIVGDVHIKENTQFNSVEADTIIVSENVTARLFGTIKKLIVLKPGSKVLLHGRVHGDIKNEGGELKCFLH
jgi:hypothetical protein